MTVKLQRKDRKYLIHSGTWGPMRGKNVCLLWSKKTRPSER